MMPVNGALFFVGYAAEESSAVLELTYNYGVERYDLGSAYGHIAIEVDDIRKSCDLVRGRVAPERDQLVEDLRRLLLRLAGRGLLDRLVGDRLRRRRQGAGGTQPRLGFLDELRSRQTVEEHPPVRLGRLGKNYCLNTVESGVVEVLNIDALVYYRDSYKRTK